MVSEQNKSIVSAIKQSDLNSYKALRDLLDMAKVIADEQGDNDLAYALKLTDFIKRKVPTLPVSAGLNELYWEALKFEAPYRFESFLLYMERKRRPEKRFYQPRRKTLHIVAEDLQDLEDGKLDFYGLSMPPRVGKLISDDTPVLTKNGWARHGELKIGDYVVGLHGEWVRVNYIHPKNCANKRVWFTDHTYIDCHENHEWLVYDRSRGEERIVETKCLVNSKYTENGKTRYRFQLPVHEAMYGEDIELPMNPYVLGVWIGDGTNKKPTLTICDTDLEILEEIKSAGYKLTTCFKQIGCKAYSFEGLRDDLQKFGMCHSRRTTQKHIPDVYFTASKEQRLELIAGLLDTDGCLKRKERRYDYSTSDERLKDDVVKLISTFGWRVCVVKRDPEMSSSGINGNEANYRISFTPTFEIPCRVKRKQLKNFSKQRRIGIERVEDIESVSGNCITVEGGIYRVGERLKITHNSSICIFFLAWVIGKRPASHNAMSGHSGILADRFYTDVLKLTTSEEYTFSEIFPHIKFPKTSSDKNELRYDEVESFATLTCRGIDGTWTGAVDISADGYLYVDDMVRDRTESLSPKRLENRYQDYLNVLVDRKNDGSRELMVGTRWNVLDPLGRVETENKNNPRYRFRKIPALNEHDESNFEYEYGKGFSTQYYRDTREKLDRNEWMAKYQQKPFIREGLLFPLDELDTTFNGVLPDGDCLTAAACDIAWGGGDSLSMPFGKAFGSKEDGPIYIPDWIFNKGDKYVTKPLVVAKTLQHKPNMVRFEANNGGDEYAESVDTMLKAQGFKTNITWAKASNQVGKMAKIIQYAPDIKRRFRFLKPELQSEEYRAAMEELGMITQVGKNEHDDSADGLVQLLQLVDGGTAKVQIYSRSELGV